MSERIRLTLSHAAQLLLLYSSWVVEWCYRVQFHIHSWRGQQNSISNACGWWGHVFTEASPPPPPAPTAAQRVPNVSDHACYLYLGTSARLSEVTCNTIAGTKLCSLSLAAMMITHMVHTVISPPTGLSDARSARNKQLAPHISPRCTPPRTLLHYKYCYYSSRPIPRQPISFFLFSTGHGTDVQMALNPPSHPLPSPGPPADTARFFPLSLARSVGVGWCSGGRCSPLPACRSRACATSSDSRPTWTCSGRNARSSAAAVRSCGTTTTTTSAAAAAAWTGHFLREDEKKKIRQTSSSPTPHRSAETKKSTGLVGLLFVGARLARRHRSIG